MKPKNLIVFSGLAFLVGYIWIYTNTSEAEPLPHSNAAYYDAFYVGGKYVEENGKQHMAGQMYVEAWAPEKVTQKYPVVFIHGLGQTGFNWSGTPDGRDGWADYFLRHGFAVYLVDQPSRGRSSRLPESGGVLRTSPVELVEKLFTASAKYGSWPQAKKHTQWPGEGVAGDPIFDNFYRAIVPSLASNALSEQLVRDAASALLDKIGPAVVLVHSQAGLFGWSIADARPNLVKAIVAIEPSGPPFQNATKTERELAWGLTNIPVAYEPAAKTPGDLAITLEPQADGPDLLKCFLQKEPARKLKNLQDIPVLMVTGEASYHAQYDHCSAKFLQQAGVDTTYWRLENMGIHGNGHLMMLEKNNGDIALKLIEWLESAVTQ